MKEEEEEEDVVNVGLSSSGEEVVVGSSAVFFPPSWSPSFRFHRFSTSAIFLIWGEIVIEPPFYQWLN